MITGAFITRTISPDQRGVYSVMQADLDLFTLLLGLSLNSALIYYIAGKKVSIERMLGIVSKLIFFSAIVLALVLGTLVFNFDSSFIFPKNYSTPFYACYLFIAFLLTMTNTSLSSIFQGVSNFKVVNLVALLNSVFNVTIFGSMFLYDHLNPGIINVKHVLGLSAFVFMMNAVVWLYFYKKHINALPDYNFSYKADVRPMFAFLGIVHTGHVLNHLNYRLDIWIVDHYDKTGMHTEVAFYSLAANIAMMFWMIPGPLSSVLLPYISGGKDEKNEVFMFFSRVNTTVSLILLGAAALVCQFIIPLVYGKDFINSVLPFRLLLPGIFFSCIFKFFAVYIASHNKVKYNLIATIAGLTCTVVFNLLLVPQFGGAGASVATSIAYLVILGFTLYFTFVSMKLPKGNYFLLTASDIGHIYTKVRSYAGGRALAVSSAVNKKIPNPRLGNE